MSAVKEFDGKRLFSAWCKSKSIGRVYIDDHLVSVDSNTDLSALPSVYPWLLSEKLVVKIDQLVKRRGKLGLVKVNVNWNESRQWISTLVGKDYTIEGQTGVLTDFLVEKCLPHKQENEMYIALRPYHDRYPTFSSGDEILFCSKGGVEMGEESAGQHKSNILSLKVPLGTAPTLAQIKDNLLGDVQNEQSKTLVSEFVKSLFDFYVDSHHIFLEINPFVVLPESNQLLVLDWAGKLDPDARWECRNLWNDLVFPEGFGATRLPEENLVRELDSETGASFKLTVLNPKGAIWTLVAGGGASVMYADTICSLGFASELGNYGEYSGNPSTDLTMRYTDALVRVMLKNKLTTPKVLLIGGAVANFTSVVGTFKGIIKALTPHVDELIAQKVFIYVRRGGPGYEEGLTLMRKFAKDTKVMVEAYGPDVNMVYIVHRALEAAFPTKVGSLNAGANATYKVPYQVIERAIEAAKRPANPEFPRLFSPQATCIVYALRPDVIQRMLDFDFASARPTPSVAAVVDPMTSQAIHKCFFGNKEVLLKVFPTVESAFATVGGVSIFVNLASSRSVFSSVREAMKRSEIKVVAIFAEGVPERQARLLAQEANQKGVCLIGPATVGGLHPGAFRIGSSGGTIENILHCRLYRPGSVGYVTRSGGMSNELNYLLSRTTNGVYEGIAIGGDRYPGSGFLEHLLRFESDPNVKMMVLLGEVGGVAEYAVVEALKSKKLTKPLIAMCTGVTAEKLNKPGMKFGHAGASATESKELASVKNEALKEAGALVPSDFEEFERIIQNTYKELHKADLVPQVAFDSEEPRPLVPMDLDEARQRGLVRVPTHIISTISDDRKSELQYHTKSISEVVAEPHNIGAVIGLLWFKKSLPVYMSEFLEKVVVIVADHGPAVSGAHNTIVTSRAGKDLVSCLVSGLLTIGDRFGGAINGAATNFYEACQHGTTADAFVADMKKKGLYIPGIGHRVKSLRNPDIRVQLLVEYAQTHFPSTSTLDFALKVEKVTTQKKENLILNVDGAIGACMVDLLCNCGIFEQDEGRKYIEIGCLNGLFVVGRSIGLLGHAIDQKRLDANLYRHDTADILYDISL